MPSTNKTPNLGLNQWLGTDKPKREDWNLDNSLTEQAIFPPEENWIPVAPDGFTLTTTSAKYKKLGNIILTKHYFTIQKTGTPNATENFTIKGVPIGTSYFGIDVLYGNFKTVCNNGFITGNTLNFLKSDGTYVKNSDFGTSVYSGMYSVVYYA